MQNRDYTLTHRDRNAPKVLKSNRMSKALMLILKAELVPRQEIKLGGKTRITHRDRNAPKVLKPNRLSKALMLILEAQSWFSDKA